MTKHLLTLIAGLGLSTTALAREHRPDNRRFGQRPEACDDLKLSDQQRAQMRDLHLKFEDERIDLEAKARHARVELQKQFAAKDADAKAIRKAALAAAEADAKVHVAEELQRTEVLLSVFKPEQREQALGCGGRGFGMHHRPDGGMRPRGPAALPDGLPNSPANEGEDNE